MPTDRELQQEAAREGWSGLKTTARYWRSWKYTPDHREHAGSRTYRAWLASMRNAWVAYHAGASWMHGPFAGAGYLMARNLSAELDEARAEVERLTAERDDARQLASYWLDMYIAASGDDVDCAELPWEGPPVGGDVDC